MADQLGSYPQFRLNSEQQGKRAKELLKAARAGQPEALARFKSPPKLAEAQYLIAQELRFDNWAALKRHIAAMTREREAVQARMALSPDAHSLLDGELRTLHIRCGGDLEKPLEEAGFRGDYYEHNYPYLMGPVCEGPECLEQRARFIVNSYADSRNPPLQYEPVLDGLERDEQRLHDSADYDRVVIWSELDCYDQLVLLRLLGHYATHRRPPRLELINVGEFPGTVRFIGLGQLPPEALPILWKTRTLATPAVLKLGFDAWHAGQGDLNVRNRLLNIEGASARVYERRPGVDRNGEARPPWTDVLTITDLGRAVLKGQVDFLSLAPPNRWVGGVQIGPGQPDWRWNEQSKAAVRID